MKQVASTATLVTTIGCGLFLVFYTVVRQFDSSGSMFAQGYIGSFNLNNAALGAFILLIAATITNRLLLAKQHKQINPTLKLVYIALLLVILYFLAAFIIFLHGAATGHLLDGWQF